MLQQLQKKQINFYLSFFIFFNIIIFNKINYIKLDILNQINFFFTLISLLNNLVWNNYIYVLFIFFMYLCFLKKKRNFFLLFFFFQPNNIYYLSCYYYYAMIEISNFKLLNGLMLFHPVFLIISYVVYIYICVQNHKNFSVFLITENFFLKNKTGNLIYFFILTLFLGSWWAFQELNWGGWWGWDLIEIILFNLFILILYFIHLNSDKSLIKYKVVYDCLLLLLLYFYLNRTTFFMSIHSFINDSKFNQYIYIFILYIIIYLCYFKIRLNLHKKFNFLFSKEVSVLRFSFVLMNILIIIILLATIFINFFFKKNILLFVIFFKIFYFLIIAFLFLFLFSNQKISLFLVFFFIMKNFYEYIALSIISFLRFWNFKKINISHFFFMFFILYLILFIKINYIYNDTYNYINFFYKLENNFFFKYCLSIINISEQFNKNTYNIYTIFKSPNNEQQLNNIISINNTQNFINFFYILEIIKSTHLIKYENILYFYLFSYLIIYILYSKIKIYLKTNFYFQF